MSPALSILGSVVLFPLIIVLAAREVSRFRKDQSSRSELYPYSKKRLTIRSSVSACLLIEAALLFWGPHFFAGRNYTWFMAYVSAIVLIAAGMAVLAILDLRESRHLAQLSQKRLLQELVEDLKQGVKEPEIH